MNKEAMQAQILEALSKKLGDSFHLSVEKTLKTNTVMDGLRIKQDGDLTIPTIYLEPFYEALETGMSISAVIDKILYAYHNGRAYTPEIDLSLLNDFALAKDRLYVQLINRQLNENLLQDTPHSLFLNDFAVVVRCMVGASKDSSISFLVHKNHLEMWHIDQKTLMSCALQNTRKQFGIDLLNLGDFLGLEHLKPTSNDKTDHSIWIVTNEQKLFGAATVLFDDVLKDFANEHGSFYVLFSSIHEIMLLPASGIINVDRLNQINQEVNATQLEPDEVLGTKAYLYSKDHGFVL